jgi:DNA polymerase-2
MEHTGWLLDLFADPQGGVILWLLGDDGQRYRLQQAFTISFFAAGPAPRLRALWRFLEEQPIPVRLSRDERRDLFQSQPLTVLAIQLDRPALQPRLFRQVVQRFPELTYYDADVQLTLRYAAENHVFPLARCRVRLAEDGQVEQIAALDSPWDLEPLPPQLRVLHLEPDCDPAHALPTRLSLRCGRATYQLPLSPTRPLLLGLRSIINRHDPDLLLTSWGDTWLMPLLLDLSRQAGLALPLNREVSLAPAHRPERTYFSYGQVIYQGRQVLLFGRWHIDRYNAMLFHDYGMHGVYELSRVTSLPVQTAARVSPGSGISAMQILTAMRMGVLVPWHKQQAERPKTVLDLMRADQGGLVYQPTIGLHYDVAEIDFISMYPSIMVHFNISPETVGSSRLIANAAPELGAPGDPQPPGLVPQTLAPLLKKRLALKTRLATLPPWHPQRQAFKARTSAHKWLLVTCFGYLGYKNARFGRIEAHEAVTAYGREALLRAKEAAEDLGFDVLHLYVDGMWIARSGASQVADFQAVLDAISQRTGLPIALEGIYRWVAFLASRLDARVPVANRYFGVFQDGSIKVRGIEARRRDAPPFIAQTQAEMLSVLAHVSRHHPVDLRLPEVLNLLRGKLRALREGRLPLEQLLVAQKLSRTLDEYRTPSVYAWNLPQAPDPASVDIARYSELLLRAATAILEPFGVSEQLLAQWLFSNAAYHAPPGVLPGKARPALPLWNLQKLLEG